MTPLQEQNKLGRNIINKCETLSGSDYLSDITVGPTSTVNDTIKLNKLITPSDYLGTRVTALSNLWERYRIRKFNIRYVPAVPNTIACQLLAYQDTDPLDDPTNFTTVDALIRQGMAQTGSRLFNFNTKVSIPLAQRKDDEFYYTGLEKQNLRFNAQGKFYLLQVTEPLDFNGAPLLADIKAGSIYVDWVIDFDTPQINPSAIVNPSITEKSFNFDLDASTRKLQLELTKDAYVSLGKVSSQTVKSTHLFDGLVVGEYDDEQSDVRRYFNDPIFFTAGSYTYKLQTPGTYAFSISLNVVSLDADVSLILG